MSGGRRKARQYSSEPRVQVNFTLDQQLKATLDTIAARNCRYVTQECRLAVLQYIERNRQPEQHAA